MGRRVSARAIKAHRQYTYDEAARVLGTTAQTVRSWRKLGLVVIDDQKPHLIVGACLKEFCARKRAKQTVRLKLHEFKCLSCDLPRGASGGLANYIPLTPKRGRLNALCEFCEGKCSKFIGASQLGDLAGMMTVETRNGS